MFRTEISVPANPEKILLNEKLLTCGSCFAQIIGQKLQQYKFEATINPFGTIYNPVSIFNLLQMVVKNSLPAENSYLENQGTHRNFLVHSDLSALELPELKLSIAQKINQLHNALTHLRWIMITFGTGYSYLHKDLNLVVANCHKVPAQKFEKRLLETEQITESFSALHKELNQLNPGLNWILTVSPVRHVRDNLVQNSVSKAVLRLAAERIVNRFSNCFYFPSYELMMDDLRDYRFYHKDMIHTNEVAEDYIWQKFTGSFMDDETREFISRWDEILKASQHRPFHPDSPRHQQFLLKTIEKLKGLSRFTDTSEEIKYFQQQLK